MICPCAEYAHPFDAIFDVIHCCGRIEPTRTTITIDDDLLEKAASLTRIEERRALIREALRALIERESARRLARLGGSQPDLEPAPRRRSARAG